MSARFPCGHADDGGYRRMSLVHEALQKAERERQRKTGAAPSAPAATPVAPLGQSTPAQAPRLPEPIPSAPHPVVSRKPAPPVEAAPRANQFLLPVLIGCVAIVAMIAIVFLVSNATSVLRQSEGKSAGHHSIHRCASDKARPHACRGRRPGGSARFQAGSRQRCRRDGDRYTTTFSASERFEVQAQRDYERS